MLEQSTLLMPSFTKGICPYTSMRADWIITVTRLFLRARYRSYTFHSSQSAIKMAAKTEEIRVLSTTYVKQARDL